MNISSVNINPASTIHNKKNVQFGAEFNLDKDFEKLIKSGQLGQDFQGIIDRLSRRNDGLKVYLIGPQEFGSPRIGFVIENDIFDFVSVCRWFVGGRLRTEMTSRTYKECKSDSHITEFKKTFMDFIKPDETDISKVREPINDEIELEALLDAEYRARMNGKQFDEDYIQRKIDSMKKPFWKRKAAEIKPAQNNPGKLNLQLIVNPKPIERSPRKFRPKTV